MVKPTTGIFQNKVKYIKGTVWCLKKLGDKFLSDISRKEKISYIILILALVRQSLLFIKLASLYVTQASVLSTLSVYYSARKTE